MNDEEKLINIYNQASNFFHNNKLKFKTKSKHWSYYYKVKFINSKI